MKFSCGIGADKRATVGLCGVFNHGLVINGVIISLCPCFVSNWEFVPLVLRGCETFSAKIELVAMAVSHLSKIRSNARAASFLPSLRRLI